MRINGRQYRSIWLGEDTWSVHIFDQTKLPHALEILTLTTMEQAAHAIRSMQVRGAPLLAMTGAYALALALREDASDAALNEAYNILLQTRPTAVNLKHALGDVKAAVMHLPPEQRASAAYQKAASLCDEDVAINEAIGRHGLGVIEAIAAKKKPGETIHILTHCNAGWIATVDWGTALAPIYMAHDKGIPVHIWVDETRPRNQGALTSWELGNHGVSHTVIVDNAGGQLMRNGRVEMCIVGTDRVTANGDVCNKIGTYLKALAAYDNNVPFYVALPSPTIDWTMESGDAIPIEERAADEVTHIGGVAIYPEGVKVSNLGFDVTPARLITGLITERGVCAASSDALKQLFNKG